MIKTVERKTNSTIWFGSKWPASTLAVFEIFEKKLVKGSFFSSSPSVYHLVLSYLRSSALK